MWGKRKRQGWLRWRVVRDACPLARSADIYIKQKSALGSPNITSLQKIVVLATAVHMYTALSCNCLF